MPRGGIQIARDNVKHILGQFSPFVPDRITQSGEAGRQQQEVQHPNAVLASSQIIEKSLQRNEGTEFKGRIQDGAADTVQGLDSNFVIPAQHASQMPHESIHAEKERFISAMEHGITRRFGRIADEPMAGIPGAAGPPQSVDPPETVEQREEREKVKKQKAWKQELERQMEDKKQAKLAEIAKKREWEAAEEARISFERDQLKKQFDAEHAARLAKVAGDAVTGTVESMGTLATDTVAGAKESDPKPKHPIDPVKTEYSADAASTMGAQGVSMQIDDEPAPVLPAARKRGQSRLSSSFPLSAHTIIDQQANEDEKKGIVDAASAASSLDIQVLKDAVAAQLAESKRLQEAAALSQSRCEQTLRQIQDLLAFHINVGGSANFEAAGASTSAAITATQSLEVPPQQREQKQRQIQRAGDIQTSGRLQVASIPILYTTAELRQEDSRPPSRMPPPGVAKIEQHQHQHRRAQEPAPHVHDRSATSTGVTKQMDVPRKKESRVTPSLWKMATTRVKRLSVARRPDGCETTWVTEESNTAL